MYYVGVDTGGTFTDVIAFDPDSGEMLGFDADFCRVLAAAIFVQAGLTHGVLLLLGGGRLGFEATFREVAYSEATSVLLLVPLCVSWIAIVWSLVILII